MPKHDGSFARKPDWFCKSCKGRDGRPFRNFGHRSDCHLCNISKGICFGSKVVAGPPRSGGTFAERQVLLQRADEKHTKQIQQKNAELARLKAQLRGHEVVAGSEGASPTQDDAKESCDIDVEQLREHIKLLGNINGAEAVLAEKKAQLEAALQRRWDAKPVRQQLRDLQNKLDRKEKNLEKRQNVDLPSLRGAERAAAEAVTKP